MKAYIIILFEEGYTKIEIMEKLGKIGINVSSQLMDYYYRVFLRDKIISQRAIMGNNETTNQC